MVSDQEFAELCMRYQEVFRESAPTMILPEDRDEAARLLGPADWSSPEARALVDALVAEAG